MTITFTIPGRLAGANEAINAMNIHRYRGAKLKSVETDRCALCAVAGDVPKIKKPVRIHFKWIEPNRRRDLDNIRYASKFIMDGLREAGMLPNDGWQWVLGMSDTWEVDPINPRIIVEIKEAE